MAVQLAVSAGMSNGAPAAPTSLTLTVTLKDIYNHAFKVSLPVTPDVPFKVVSTNGSVTNTISGTVGEPVNGKYPLPLSVSEWKSKADNISDTTDYNLELGKPQGCGPAASIIFERFVVLTDTADTNAP